MVKSGKGSRLYLLTGLVIGYVLAYIASCTVLPLEYYDINPASLHHDLKMDYFVLIADAFCVERRYRPRGRADQRASGQSGYERSAHFAV